MISHEWMHACFALFSWIYTFVDGARAVQGRVHHLQEGIVALATPPEATEPATQADGRAAAVLDLWLRLMLVMSWGKSAELQPWLSALAAEAEVSSLAPLSLSGACQNPTYCQFRAIHAQG